MSTANNQYINMSNREIRSYARDSLVGNMLMPALVTFFLFCLKNLFNLCSQYGFVGKGVPAFIFYIALFIILNTIYGIVNYGITRYFLAFITTKKASFSEVFAGLRHSTNTILLVSFIITMIDLICLSPYFIYGFFLAPNTSQGLLITMILYFVGNLIGYLISIKLAPVYFIICDFESIQPPLVFILSLSLMNTKAYFKYLFLQISFIPFYLLGYLSLGIGLLWVIPYAYCSYAYFYETICENIVDKMNKEKSEN